MQKSRGWPGLLLTSALGMGLVLGCGGSGSTSGSYVPTGAPAITFHPQNLEVNPGSSATFVVIASGQGTLSYQWQKNGSALSGATRSNYEIPSCTLADSGLYDVVVSNAYGQTVSQAAKLTVIPPSAPKINSFKATPDAITPGKSSTLSWDVSLATSITIDQNIGDVTGKTPPSTEVYPTSTKTYTLQATNPAGTSRSSVTIVVGSEGLPDYDISVADPSPVQAGQNATATATVVRKNGHVAAISIEDVGGNIKAAGTVPASATTGTVTFTVPAGTANGKYPIGLLANDGGTIKPTSCNVTVLNVALPTFTSFSPTSGQTGSTVTLTGSGFNYVTGVKFNGVTAAYTKKSDTSIEATVPATATSGKIAVSYSVSGVTGTLESSSSFSVVAAPVTIAISPTSATVEPGKTQQFTATVTGSSNTAVTWSADLGTVSATGLYTAPATAGTAKVKATSVADTSKSAEATVTVKSGGGGGGNTVTWTNCTDYVWVAYQDGDGPWTKLDPVNHVYSFEVKDANKRFGIVAVWKETASADTYTVYEHHGITTDQPWLGSIPRPCPGTTKTIDVKGTVTGHGSDMALVTLSAYAHDGAPIASGSKDWTVKQVAVPDVADLIATKNPAGTGYYPPYGVPTRMAIRRDINLAENAPNPTTLDEIKLDGSESFALAAHTATATGADTGETVSFGGYFYTENGSAITLPYTSGANSAPFAGVPSANQKANDYHYVSATGSVMDYSDFNNIKMWMRWIWQYFKAPGDKSLALPPKLDPVAHSTVATTPYARLKTTWPSSAKYTWYSLSYMQTTSKHNWYVTLSPGWYLANGTTKGTFTHPDLQNVSGWNSSAWGLSKDEKVTTSVGGYLWTNYADWHIVDGTTQEAAMTSGSHTP